MNTLPFRPTKRPNKPENNAPNNGNIIIRNNINNTFNKYNYS